MSQPKDLSQLSIDPSRRVRRGQGKRLLLAAIVVAAIAVAITVAVGLARHAAAVETSVVREAVSSQAAVLNASGYVTPRRRATVSAKVTGEVKDILIDEGMGVEEGQVLARLDDVDALAQLRASEAEESVAVSGANEVEAQLANARRSLERTRELRADNLVSQESLDDAETAVAVLVAQTELARDQIVAARRATDIARQNLDDLVIRAPFAGIVVSKDAQPGEMVSPISAGGGYTRTGIATIVDMTSLEIEVDVNESYIARVSPGQRVEATLDAYPDWQIPASVRTVIPTADREKATVKVRIAFDRLDPRILPDMGVKVSFLESAPESASAGGAPGSSAGGSGGAPFEGSATVLVARDAVKAEGDQHYVFVVKGGRVERRAVKVGRERGADLEITAGLRTGEEVVVRSDKRLRDGARVSVKQR